MEGKYLLLGTNLGHKLNNLQKAVNLLAEHHIEIKQSSSIYESEPWGIKEQPNFYNVVLEVQTSLQPKQLLTACLAIEKKMGRKRIVKWGERIIDIDILYFDDVITSKDDLTIPHSGIPIRRFTLQPLVELSPKLLHPELKKSNQQLLEECKDELRCEVLENKLIL
ncbi:MAG: 2-amino-4-hydroxy-6-hydroxymethyldihydropteridine diphosphokinase [Cyclobacteriaceae bacterium]